MTVVVEAACVHLFNLSAVPHLALEKTYSCSGDYYYYL